MLAGRSRPRVPPGRWSGAAEPGVRAAQRRCRNATAPPDAGGELVKQSASPSSSRGRQVTPALPCLLATRRTDHGLDLFASPATVARVVTLPSRPSFRTRGTQSLGLAL